ncbi:MAG TPA: DUF411 domain-containing protein [Paracoccus sp. (in: a-proteobacteria)]|uniref:DUF411 domain-containing protein n=1 Tax=uncultured Paracoccus sp. TaxID=189685 RepID=UPI00262DE5C8|nr:DUF411 domain-containing protein [uncultured Paracoccus sp.]HMQ42687.1 DUF411 domain-containing protein [Paracoccus sp. (in: a-proteobacteria)]HMR36729.1 DUF411 domain-containing protein [Paracoccus sp. (in: a-proteobacteria)]
MKIQLAGLAALFLSTTAAFAEGAQMTVHKDPNCGCCTAWADLAQDASYEVAIIEDDDLYALKDRLGVPADMQSCHTVEVGGYVIEGHVPLQAVERLLSERPDATGIAVPGMPAGSPGMGDDPDARYDVVIWGGEAGDGALYERMGPDRP